MSNPEWTKLILDKMYGVLKPAGFRKRGGTFYRTVADVVQLVGLQSNRLSTQDVLSCVVNLGVFSPALQDKLFELGDHWTRIETPRLAVGSAHWLKGLRGLAPGGSGLAVGGAVGRRSRSDLPPCGHCSMANRCTSRAYQLPRTSSADCSE